jgi:hypothetical protein
MSIQLCGTDRQGFYGHRAARKTVAQTELEMGGYVSIQSRRQQGPRFLWTTFQSMTNLMS